MEDGVGPDGGVRMTVRILLGLGLVLRLVTAAVAGEDALADAGALLALADRDPPAIERARDRLEAELRPRGLAGADPPLLIELSRIWYLHGELRAAANAEKVASFERGKLVGEEAVRRVPGDARAHLWYAINLGRWAEERGLFRSMLALRTLREEAAETLRLDPGLADAHVFAGALAANLPGLAGGDSERAEAHFRRAVELDPRRSRFRLELAQFLIGNDRIEEARPHLAAVLAESQPSDPIFAALRDRPAARRLLGDLGPPK